ncbi:MAG: uracil-DNA glycosylase [Candidatus Izimaplasma sp.]|nr:uracil-DNA glycosylase [Candidatus Izimaplasma bacterium]
MNLPSDWQQVLEAQYDMSYLYDLIDYLNQEYKQKTIYPRQNDVFNALTYCSFKAVKVIIIGQDPYHNPNQAHGLAFSVKKGVKIPPSLQNIFKELNNDLGFEIPSHGDLSFWAKQGVLLLNAILTVEENKPLSHQGLGWERLLEQIIMLLDKNDTPKVFVLWGNKAKKYQSLITNSHHLKLTSSHPSPLSARHSFYGSRVFSSINTFLKTNHRMPIDFQLKN